MSLSWNLHCIGKLYEFKVRIKKDPSARNYALIEIFEGVYFEFLHEETGRITSPLIKLRIVRDLRFGNSESEFDNA